MRLISDPHRARQIIIAGWYLAAVLAGMFALVLVPQGRAAEHGPHKVLLKELGQRLPITQVFDLSSDGLHMIELQLWASARADVTVEYQATLSGGPGPATTIRGTRKVDARAGVQPLRLEFPAIRRSGGTVCTLRIRASEISGATGDAGVQPEVALVASRDRPTGPAYLTVGAEERWGALHFDTAATGDNLLGRLEHKILSRFPAATRNAVVIAGTVVLALCSLLLLPFIGLLIETPRTTSAPTTASGRVLLGAGICAFLAAALGVTWWMGREERGQKHLMDHLYQADIRTDGPLHTFFDLVYEDVNGEAKRAIFAHAPTRVAWMVTPERGMTLKTWAALQPRIWRVNGDGVTFRIQVKEGNDTSDLLTRHVDPSRVAADRGWIPMEVDLSRYAGRQVELVLMTDPSPAGVPPDSRYDRALWGDPKIGY